MEFALNSTMLINNILVTFVHFDSETQEFSFERLLSHIDNGIVHEIIVLSATELYKCNIKPLPGVI